MGWTFTNKDGMTVQKFFERQFNYDKPEEKRSAKILRCSATWNVAYMAYEVITGEKREVVALVCLIQHVPKAKDGYTFGYKDMTECMGPCESKCPKTILEMLTPTESKYASDWRDRCWKRIHERAAKPKVKQGDWIKFEQPIKFRDGSELDTFVYLKGNDFKTSPQSYGYYNISGWRDRKYENKGQKYEEELRKAVIMQEILRKEAKQQVK